MYAYRDPLPWVIAVLTALGVGSASAAASAAHTPANAVQIGLIAAGALGFVLSMWMCVVPVRRQPDDDAWCLWVMLLIGAISFAVGLGAGFPVLVTGILVVPATLLTCVAAGAALSAAIRADRLPVRRR